MNKARIVLNTMVLIILILLTPLCINSANAFTLLPWKSNDGLYKFEVIRVTDGDTIKVYINDFPKNLQKTTVRLAKIDTPELGSKAQCEEEKVLAIKAREYVKNLLNKSNKIRFRPLGYEKYGRILAEVFIDGNNLANKLLEANLATPYTGGHKENPWCE